MMAEGQTVGGGATAKKGGSLLAQVGQKGGTCKCGKKEEEGKRERKAMPLTKEGSCKWKKLHVFSWGIVVGRDMQHYALFRPHTRAELANGHNRREGEGETGVPRK